MNKKIISFRHVVLVIFLIVFRLIAYSQTCEVRITKPSEGSQVAGTALISGTATLPSNGHLWILAHQVGFNGFWPQGNGEVLIIGKDWDVFVYFGTPGNYGKFEIVALVVDDQAHKYLEEWVLKAPNTTPPYQPISLPTIIDSCSIAKLRVDKTKD